MNRDCHGDFFKVEEVRYYRCFKDGSVTEVQVGGTVCEACRRPIRANEHGEVKAETITRTRVTIDIGGDAVYVYLD